MAILAKPSRSYAEVDHDPNGLSGVGNAPYRRDGFKTYRPSLIETHLKRPIYDSHPSSAFSPLNSGFPRSRHARRDQAIAGHQAELDQILQPEFKSQLDLSEPDTASTAGPSRSATSRTAGGIRRKELRPTASLSSFRQPTPAGRVGGIYIDANGKAHDTEFDPFGHIAEMTRKKSRRKSAFGSDRRRGSETSSSGSGSSSEDEAIQRLEAERRRLDEVSSLAAAKRRSMGSDRSIRDDQSMRSRQYVPSPLSPNFQQHRPMTTAIEERDSPKSTEYTGSTKVTKGFDAPQASPLPQFEHLRIPDAPSRRSSESTRSKPPEPTRENLYPETPAQAKRREERRAKSSLAVDTVLSSRARVLPEIEIVEDDDPRIVFPENGKTTRVQTVHDHVIRNQLARAVQAQGRRPSDHSAKSIRSVKSGSIGPSTLIDQVGGGYLPSRWANGDKQLRVTEDEKEKYRPREWGGKTGDLGGREEEWRPTVKEELKRNMKELSTAARFGMFRAKKKLLRKAEL